MPQTIFAHLSNQRAAKKHAPYRTFPKPRTSAERGQENGQRNYRAPSRTMFYETAQQKRGTATPKSATQGPSFSLHRAPAAAAAFRSATARRAALSAEMRVSFSPAGRKRNGGRIPFPERKKPPRPSGAHPRFPEREKLTPPTGPHSPQRRGKECAAHPATQVQRRKPNPFYNILYD